MAGSPNLIPTSLQEKKPKTSRNNPDVLLLRPAIEPGWELWATSPGLPRETGRFETFPDLAKKNLRTVALPALHTLVFSRWLLTVDESLLPEMVQVILERQGLSPRDEGGKSFSFSTVLKEENRTLVSIRLLSPSIPAELCRPQVERFEIGADLQPLVNNGLTIWRESGRLVAAFSRSGFLVHLQSFQENIVSESIGIELLCSRLQLETEEIIPPQFTISLLGSFSEDEKSILTSLLGISPVTSFSEAPQLPVVASSLTPPLVEIERQKIRNRERIERTLLAVAAVYALILFALILNVGWLTYTNKSKRKSIAQNQPTVATIKATDARWKSMQAAINPQVYPVEVLFQSAAVLPEDGVRFTLFEETNNKVRIRGEANSAAAAFKLAEDLKSKEELSYFDWKMPQPHVLPNDKAEFQIEGNPPDA